MSEEEEVKEILLELLRLGLLRIRMFGWAGQARACSDEADHLHNLPALIRSFHWDLVHFYYDVERPCLLKRTSDVAAFEPLWDRLAIILLRAGK